MRIVNRLSNVLPQERRHVRSHNPLVWVRIDGRRYRCTDWSLGGLNVGDFTGAPEVGEKIQGQLGFSSNLPGEFTGEVVAKKQGGNVGVKFAEMSPELFMSMAGIKGL